MKYLVILVVWACTDSFAQDTKSTIMEPVETLFAGMNRGDSSMVRKAFVTSPMIATVLADASAASVIRYDDFEEFLIAIAAPHPQPWNEPIWDVKIESDGNLAHVWANYAFYVGRKFSHCGVDAFQLVKGSDDKWRIFFLADTRRSEGCNVPSFVSERFK